MESAVWVHWRWHKYFMKLNEKLIFDVFARNLNSSLFRLPVATQTTSADHISPSPPVWTIQNILTTTSSLPLFSDSILWWMYLGIADDGPKPFNNAASCPSKWHRKWFRRSSSSTQAATKYAAWTLVHPIDIDCFAAILVHCHRCDDNIPTTSPNHQRSWPFEW